MTDPANQPLTGPDRTPNNAVSRLAARVLAARRVAA